MYFPEPFISKQPTDVSDNNSGTTNCNDGTPSMTTTSGGATRAKGKWEQKMESLLKELGDATTLEQAIEILENDLHDTEEVLPVSIPFEEKWRGIYLNPSVFFGQAYVEDLTRKHIVPIQALVRGFLVRRRIACNNNHNLEWEFIETTEL